MGASDHPYSNLSATKEARQHSEFSPPGQNPTSDQREEEDAPKKTGRGIGATISMAVPYNRWLHPKEKASHPSAQQLCKKWLYGLGGGWLRPLPLGSSGLIKCGL